MADRDQEFFVPNSEGQVLNTRYEAVQNKPNVKTAGLDNLSQMSEKYKPFWSTERVRPHGGYDPRVFFPALQVQLLRSPLRVVNAFSFIGLGRPSPFHTTGFVSKYWIPGI